MSATKPDLALTLIYRKWALKKFSRKWTSCKGPTVTPMAFRHYTFASNGQVALRVPRSNAIKGVPIARTLDRIFRDAINGAVGVWRPMPFVLDCREMKKFYNNSDIYAPQLLAGRLISYTYAWLVLEVLIKPEYLDNQGDCEQATRQYEPLLFRGEGKVYALVMPVHNGARLVVPTVEQLRADIESMVKG